MFVPVGGRVAELHGEMTSKDKALTRRAGQIAMFLCFKSRATRLQIVRTLILKCDLRMSIVDK